MVISAPPISASLRGSPVEPQGTAFRRYSGSPHPFGSTVEADGVNFSLFSGSATAVELLIFARPEDLDPVKVITFSGTENKSFNIFEIRF